MNMLQENQSRYIWNIESMARDDDWQCMLLSPLTAEWQDGLDKFISTIFEGSMHQKLHHVHVQGVVTSCTRQKKRFRWTC